MEFNGRLGLNNEFAVNKHIQTLSSKYLTLVKHGYIDFSNNFMTDCQELPFKRRDVKVFVKTEAEVPINFEEPSNN